jgi:capsular exopolysaccharide synthesis family protein
VELRDYIQSIRKNWILIAAVALVGLLAGGGISLITTPTYTSSTSVFVAIQSNGTTGSELNAGTTYVQNQVKSFAQVATTDVVLQPVIDKLDLQTTVEELAERVVATAPLDLVIIDISVTDTSPTRAADIANAIGTQLIATVEDLSETSLGDSPVKVTRVSPALEATGSVSPNVRLNLALGLLIGLLLGIGAAVLREILDTRVHGDKEIAQITDATLLGGITFDAEAKDRPLVVQLSPHSPRAEAFRQLRTNLQFVEVTDGGRTFVITSSMPSEGKSTTSVNLAITLAEAGTKVLLVDGDLRRPKVAEYMGVEGSVGLTDHLIGQVELDDVIQPWGNGALSVLPAGQIPPNPSELLGSKAMVRLLETLNEHYEVIIIDAPPLLPVTDAAVLSKLATGGAIMVVGSGTITKHQLQAAVSSLNTVGGRLIGVIMNLLPPKGTSAYSYYGYYGQDVGKKDTVVPEQVAKRPRTIKSDDS